MIKVNSEKLSGYDGVKLLDLLEEKKYKLKFIAVEMNGSIVPKNDYENIVLKDGDVLEVVSFVGGG